MWKVLIRNFSKKEWPKCTKSEFCFWTQAALSFHSKQFSRASSLKTWLDVCSNKIRRSIHAHALDFYVGQAGHDTNALESLITDQRSSRLYRNEKIENDTDWKYHGTLHTRKRGEKLSGTSLQLKCGVTLQSWVQFVLVSLVTSVKISMFFPACGFLNSLS